MYQKRCSVCGKDFESIVPQTLTCSLACRNARLQKITGREAWQKNITSPTVGAISEMMVGIDLMKKGFAVFRALSASCFCDLVAIKDGKINTIEARTGYTYAGIGDKGKVSYPRNAHGKIDYFGIYVPAQNKVYYFTETHESTNI